MPAESFRHLKKLSDDELIDRYDALAKRTQVGTDHYLNELYRRRQTRQTNHIVCLTWAIAGMTAFISIATFVNVAIFIYEVAIKG